MASWWQKPYSGAPPPGGLPPFIRPLYPPSAKNKGKTPSTDGKDVQAVKRAISRLGRWPWQNFDDSYSDGFALGSPSSEVTDSGMAGFQRQQGIDDTGWMGEKTYNALAYALVPYELPHGGEPAFDKTAIDLLNQAAEEISQPQQKLTRKAIPSPNYSSRGGASVRLIVLHTAEGATTI